MSMIPVRVGGVTIEESTKSPIVLLQEIEGNRVLPIWIGPLEASAIHMELAGKKYQRPLTHDLLMSMLDRFQAKVSRVVVTDLVDKTFFASIYVDAGQGAVAFDARPSDGIALALRARAPLFVTGDVFDRAGQDLSGPRPEKTPEEKAEELRRYLEGLNPEDFGKWNPEDA